MDRWIDGTGIILVFLSLIIMYLLGHLNGYIQGRNDEYDSIYPNAATIDARRERRRQ